ncbi:disintegrin and metalloproteinase domain-containing protein 11-like isoform X2 [Acanthopagrus latus]|uniref:disintegrin and metalloproteinase domain-containing protein 11-like isoform X2 n=1 Tax=Acanthopagrus latus TaxID=8177 RepID=UPI00187D00F3|nr:disintegrin and metalloproteinase domain-containing protein 11-like isoform X2 [Acanthopagrus latus]
MLHDKMGNTSVAHTRTNVDSYHCIFMSHLLSSEYVERNFNQDGRPSQSVGGEHCYYQGRLRGLPESWAALSTCHGLCGMFSDGFFSYGIEPIHNGSNQDDGAHLIRRMPDIRLSPHCKDCAEDSQWESRGGDSDEDRPDQMMEQQASGGLKRSKRFVRKPSVQTETKYIELMVVNDNDMFVQLRRSSSQTKNFAKAVVNMADAIYKEQLNTRIVLVAMETWSSKNMMPVMEDPLITLQNFMKYRKDNIREQSDVVHLFSGRTFHSSRSGTAYTGGVCSLTRGGGINEYGNVGAMAITLCQSLGQNIGMRWNNARNSAGDCRCPDAWLGCIMEDTGYYLPRKFSRCSVDEYIQFLIQGGGSCLFNKPNKLLDPPECGNGFVEPGEECDCGSQVECARSGGACCKKCTLTHDAMCSNGLCCSLCKYERRGVVCRDAVNDCDIPETCTGDSSQCPHNVHKLDGYMCDSSQGRCYGGRCRTRDGQCRGLWGYNSADRFCYEKLNAEGTEKGNCGPGPEGQGWLQCNKPDVLCGFLFCANVTMKPKFGDLQGEVTSFTLYHQNKYLDCRGGHALLEDGSDLGYVEDGTPCGPNMMCLERRCLPVAAFNLSSCSGSNFGRICSDHGTCSNEVKCICDRDYTGKDCSVFDPIPEPTVQPGPEKKDLVEDKMAVCLSVSVSRLLLSSSSHCVVSTSEKRGTKKEKKKSSTPVPESFQTSSDYHFLHGPVCPSCPSSRLAPSSSGPVELVSPYQPNHTHVAAASGLLRIVSGPRPERAGGSPCGRHRGLPSVPWLQECASISVYVFSHIPDSLTKNISTVDQFNKRHVFPMPACLPACTENSIGHQQVNAGLAHRLADRLKIKSKELNRLLFC